jgi:hypothetical protein
MLVAITEQGLAQSTDGGRTFEPVDPAPLMVFVRRAENGTLAGVAPDGVVYTADHPHGTWTRSDSLDGQPEALTVQSARTIYAGPRTAPSW